MNPLRSDTMKIARYQLQDVLRSRWVLFYGIFFVLLTDLLFRLGGSGERVLLSLLNVVLIAIPLVTLVIGIMVLYAAREFTELLLSHPVRRSSLFFGLFLGLSVPLVGAFVLGVGIPFVAHGGIAGGAGPLAVLLGTGTALTLVFSALAFLLALSTEDRIRGLGYGLGAWILFAVVFDGGVLLALYLFEAYPMERTVLFLSVLNPVDLGRILLLLQFDLAALMGFTGAAFEQFFGSLRGQVVAASALLAWLVFPLVAGLRVFGRKNF